MKDYNITDNAQIAAIFANIDAHAANGDIQKLVTYVKTAIGVLCHVQVCFMEQGHYGPGSVMLATLGQLPGSDKNTPNPDSRPVEISMTAPRYNPARRTHSAVGRPKDTTNNNNQPNINQTSIFAGLELVPPPNKIASPSGVNATDQTQTTSNNSNDGDANVKALLTYLANITAAAKNQQ